MEHRTLTLADARKLTPAPEGVGAWADKLRSAAFDAVNEHDIQEIMEGIKKRAKEGDLNAAKMLLGYLTASAPKVQQQIVVIQSERVPASLRPALGFDPIDDDDHDDAPAPTKLTGQELAGHRESAARLLAAVGQMKAATIAAQLEIPADQIERVLNFAWFEKTTKGWRLTDAGAAAVRELSEDPAEETE